MASFDRGACVLSGGAKSQKSGEGARKTSRKERSGKSGDWQRGRRFRMHGHGKHESLDPKGLDYSIIVKLHVFQLSGVRVAVSQAGEPHPGDSAR